MAVMPQLARVNGESVIPMPPGLDALRAMALGTAGFTAALAIHRMERNGQTPARGPVVVTGATGGVGSLAIDMLGAPRLRGHRGHRQGAGVRAISSRSAPAACSLREQLALGNKPLEAARFAGAIDNVGGEMLAGLTRAHGFLGKHREHRAGGRRGARRPRSCPSSCAA